MNIVTIISNVVIMTAWTCSITIIGVMLLSLVEHKSAMAPVTAISHIVYGDRAFEPGLPGAFPFFVGFALNLMAMIGWSLVAELGFHALPATLGVIASCLLVATLVAVLAYFTDFHAVPKRFTPGFEHILSRQSLLTTYGLLAISFFLGGMMRS